MILQVERYLHGPSTTNYNEYMDDRSNLEYVQGQILQDTATWNLRTPHKVLVSATSAVNALGELSPGGALMRGYQEQSLARKLIKLITLNKKFILTFFVINFRISASRY